MKQRRRMTATRLTLVSLEGMELLAKQTILAEGTTFSQNSTTKRYKESKVQRYAKVCKGVQSACAVASSWWQELSHCGPLCRVEYGHTTTSRRLQVISRSTPRKVFVSSIAEICEFHVMCTHISCIPCIHRHAKPFISLRVRGALKPSRTHRTVVSVTQELCE